MKIQREALIAIGKVRHGLTALIPPYFPIAYKLALVFTLLITSGMTVLGFFIAHNQSQVLEQQITESGNTVLRQMAYFSRDPMLANDQLSLELIASSLVSERGILGVALYNEKKIPIVKKGITADDSDVVAILGNAEQTGQLILQDGQQGDMISFSQPIVFRDITAGYALITFDGSLRQEAQRKAVRAIAGATSLLVLICILASFTLGRRITRPIHQLISAGQEISSGNYKVQFTERRRDELGLLMQSMNEMTEGLLRKEQVEKAFSKYVSPKVAQTVMDNLTEVELGGQHVVASVLFADIVGFTQLSEQMEPEHVNSLLNEYFGLIAHAAQGCSGYIDKYIGDCAMLVFGIPDSDPEHAYHAAICALVIQNLIAEHNKERALEGKEHVEFRIGINSGRMLAGNMGAAERMDYTVVGDVVNTASRICSSAVAGGILIGDELNTLLATHGIISAPFNTLALRGKKEPVMTHHVLDVSDEDRPMINQILSDIMQADSKPT
jgi:adenylate cyclase